MFKSNFSENNQILGGTAHECPPWLRVWILPGQGRSDRPPTPKTYKSNSFHHDFGQFGKQHSRYQAILPFIVMSQRCY